MTWLRWDTEAPSSDVVGHLADALNVELAHAFGLYVACCLGFGEHRPDGMAGEVGDSTLEQWALWRGKRGRFAVAFRSRCVGEDGVIRGWWRQEKLLVRQERDRVRPGEGTRKAHERPAEGHQKAHERPPLKSEGDGDVDGTVRNEQQKNSSRAVGRLINALGRDPNREAVMAVFDHLPPEENPDTWALLLMSCLQGGMAQGKSATVHQLAVGCTEYPIVAKGRWGAAHFRKCVQNVMDKPVGGRKGGKPTVDSVVQIAQDWANQEPAA